MKTDRRCRCIASLATLALLAAFTAATGTGANAAPLPNASTPSGTTHWNFEDGTLQGWTVQPGSNFGPLITDRVYYHNTPTVTRRAGISCPPGRTRTAIPTTATPGSSTHRTSP
jgi:hypothetical protein